MGHVQPHRVTRQHRELSEAGAGAVDGDCEGECGGLGVTQGDKVVKVARAGRGAVGGHLGGVLSHDGEQGRLLGGVRDAAPEPRVLQLPPDTL